LRRPVNISFRVENDIAQRERTVVPVERLQHALGPASVRIVREFEDRAAAVGLVSLVVVATDVAAVPCGA